MIEGSTSTAKERLAQSREALVLQLHGGRRPVPARARAPIQPALTNAAASAPTTASAFQSETASPRLAPRTASWVDRFAWASVGRSVARRWWRRHPANAVAQLARPLLDHYARERPGTLVLSAAGTGALMVLLRPWRLLSITAVLAAVLKTSDIADMVTTVMHRNSTVDDELPS